MRSRTLLLTVGAAFITMLFVLVGISNERSLERMFWLLGAVGALLYVGNSFPDLRKKETTMSFVMIPASVSEKFVFEFINRIVLYAVMYPVMFYLASLLSVYISIFLFPNREISQFDFDILFNFFKRDKTVLLYLMPAVCFFTISVFFAGAAIVRRHPLIKTLVTVGVFVLSVFGYFYFILFKMILNYGLQYFFEERINISTNILLEFLSAILVLSSITVSFYVYFKIKEKEV